MEKLDTTEYNQCQTRLIDLYAKNESVGNPLEFLCYRILYYIYINNNSDAMKLVAQLNPAQKADEDVQFAVKVFNAWSTGNYYQFFKLYLAAPKMSGYLMDSYVQRERNKAMKILLKSYKPTISVQRIADLLGYPDTETAIVYLDDLKVVYAKPHKIKLDCKLTLAAVDLWATELMSGFLNLVALFISSVDLKMRFLGNFPSNWHVYIHFTEMIIGKSIKCIDQNIAAGNSQ